MTRPGALLLLLAAGCASTPQPPVEYLLGPTEAAPYQRAYESFSAALGRVAVAPYLHREAIVVETGDGRLAAARRHLWAEPLPEAVRGVLADGITNALGRAVAPQPTPDSELVIDLAIERLHGTENGRVTLAAQWTLRRRNGDVLGHHRLARQVRTTADGYPALVRAHEELLVQLADAVAASLPD